MLIARTVKDRVGWGQILAVCWNNLVLMMGVWMALEKHTRPALTGHLSTPFFTPRRWVSLCTAMRMTNRHRVEM